MTKRDYNDPLYKEFRRKVLARDNRCCQWPKCRQKTKLAVHHIKRWSDNQKMRYMIRNGITLCRNHHKIVTGHEESYEKMFSEIARNNEFAPRPLKGISMAKKNPPKPKKRISKQDKFIREYLKQKEKYRK